jgi:peptidyl-prolyl cis-trans isomerase C
VKRALALGLFAAACSGNEPKKTENAALGGEVAGRAGAEVVSVELVKKVAIAQKIGAREAADRLLDDAVAADAARHRGLDRQDPARWLLTAARARITADRLFADARAKGPPTDAEVEALSEIHWREVDRPPSIQVVHTVVCPNACGRNRTPEATAHARQIAEALRPALADIASPDEFIETAKAFPHPADVEVRPEALPPFVSDGRTVTGGNSMVPAFAEGAWKLANIGDTSVVVETSFGFHIIRLVARVPEVRMPFENRRIAFAEETFARRAAKAQQVRLDDLRKGKSIQINDSAERLMRTVTNPAEIGGPPP